MASCGSYKTYLVHRILQKSPEELEERVLYQLSNATLEKILTDFENGKFYKSCEHDYEYKDLYFGKKKYYERKCE
jgi:hypothetical protein